MSLKGKEFTLRGSKELWGCESGRFIRRSKSSGSAAGSGFSQNALNLIQNFAHGYASGKILFSFLAVFARTFDETAHLKIKFEFVTCHDSCFLIPDSKKQLPASLCTTVMPTGADIRNILKTPDSCFRRNDGIFFSQQFQSVHFFRSSQTQRYGLCAHREQF